jgi:hypothetical protein
MANKRVDPALLPANFADGQVLYGADINKIITILREAVNANKLDADKILTGETTVNVFYSVSALNAVNGSLDDVGYVFNPEASGDGIKVYIHNGTSWIYKYDLSLFKVYQDVIAINTLLENYAEKNLYLEGEDLTNIKIGDLFIEFN